MARVARRWGSRDDVTVVLVYGTEAHPNQGQFLAVDQPTTDEDRSALASRLAHEEELAMDVLVDDVPRNASATYGGAPNMVYVVDPSGRVAYRALWTDATAVDRFLAAHVAGGDGGGASTSGEADETPGVAG
jgi:hypothetical protein